MPIPVHTHRRSIWQAHHDMSGPPVSPPAAAAFFDLDKTIIAGSSALAFSRPFRRQGLITRRAALRSGYAQLLIMLSGADAATVEALRRRITALCTGWEIAQIRAIVADERPGEAPIGRVAHRQKRIVTLVLKGGDIDAEFIEVESGRKGVRPSARRRRQNRGSAKAHTKKRAARRRCGLGPHWQAPGDRTPDGEPVQRDVMCT